MMTALAFVYDLTPRTATRSLELVVEVVMGSSSTPVYIIHPAERVMEEELEVEMMEAVSESTPWLEALEERKK